MKKCVSFSCLKDHSTQKSGSQVKSCAQQPTYRHTHRHTHTVRHENDYCGHPFRVSGGFPSTYHQGSPICYAHTLFMPVSVLTIIAVMGLLIKCVLLNHVICIHVHNLFLFHIMVLLSVSLHLKLCLTPLFDQLYIYH